MSKVYSKPSTVNDEGQHIIKQKELCRRLGCEITFLKRERNRVRRGEDGIPFIELGYRTIRYDWNEVLKYFERKTARCA